MNGEFEPVTPLTRREGVGEGAVLGTRREGVVGGYVRVNLPPELAALFEVLGEVASGGESDVLLVRRRDDGGRSAALKIYRHGLEPDAEALTAIRSLPREHVVEIYDCGRSSAGWWEEQEYIEHGSLAELLHAEGPRLAVGRLREVVVELAGALEAVHPVLHRDVKPTNVFVRTVEPLDLVLGDFGLARSTAFTHIVSTVAGSLAYQSPEALDGGASPARDWWAVGMIVAEAATGRHPFFDPELGWPPAAEMRIALTTRPVPLDGIEDERVRLLCRGLLVRDPRQRWGAAEVHSWLDGGSPSIAEEAATVRVDGRDAAIQPFVFAGQRCTTPEQIAPLLAQHWEEALRLISGAASEAPDYVRLAGWLEDHHHEPALRVLNASQDRSFARRLFRLLRALDPDLPPSFRGHMIDRPGLFDLAHSAVSGDQVAAATLHDILNLGILGELARENEHAYLAPLEERWRGQAELLATLTRDLGEAAVPLVDQDVERTARARILQSLLDDADLSQLASQARDQREALGLGENDSRAARLDELEGDGTEPARLIAALLLAENLAEVVVRERAEEAEREAARRAERAEAERAERDREAAAVAAAAQRRLGRMRMHDRPILRLGVVAAGTLVGPWLLGRYVWRRHLYTDSLVLPWPHPKAPFASLFLPEVVFGIGVVAAFVGLLLLRPPWPAGRGPRAAAAILLIVAGGLSPLLATAIAKGFAHHTRRSYETGPINVSALGGYCGTYYWSSRPDFSGVVSRWFVYPRDKCKVLALYRGWRQGWHLRAAADASFPSVYSYGSVMVVRENVENKPNVLMGVSFDTGRVLWRWQCRDHNPSYFDDDQYYGYDQNFGHSGSQYVTASCSYGTVRIDAMTGKASRT